METMWFRIGLDTAGYDKQDQFTMRDQIQANRMHTFFLRQKIGLHVGCVWRHQEPFQWPPSNLFDTHPSWNTGSFSHYVLVHLATQHQRIQCKMDAVPVLFDFKDEVMEDV